jgi:hypothetical protein
MSQPSRHAWVVNGLLAVVLALLLGIYINFHSQNAYAAGGGWETDGVMLACTQTTNERLVLVDTQKKNIMIYKTAGAGQFRLVGARSYKYDVELEDTAGSTVETGSGKSFTEVYHLYQSLQQPKK